MKMNKRYVLYLFATLFCSCVNNDPKSTEQLSSSLEQAEIRTYQRVTSLKQKYEKSSARWNKVRVMNASFEDNETETELTSSEQNRIQKADMEGAAIGAEYGALIGGACGGIVAGIAGACAGGVAGAGLGATFGGAGGAIGGAVIGGAIYAEVWSRDEAYAIQQEHQNDTTQTLRLYSLDLNCPINEYFPNSLLFNNSIKYSNVGLLHNYALSVLYRNNHDDFFDLTTEEMVASCFDSVFAPIDGYEHEYFSLRDALYHDIDNSYIMSHSNFSDVDFDELVQVYLEDLNDIPVRYRLSYTEEFMEIIDEELSGYDDERVALVNSCLSVFYYSSRLWRLNIPYIYSWEYVIFDNTTGIFEYVESEDIFAEYVIGDEMESECLIFVPKIINGELAALFLFDEISTLDYIHDTQFLSRGNGSSITITVTAEANINLINSSGVTIPSDTYTLERFGEGFYFLINQ